MKPMSPDELRSAFETIGLGMAKLGEHVADALKSQPGVADVHVTTSGKKKPIVGEHKEPDADDAGGASDDDADNVAKAFDLPFTIAKAEPDQQRVWGWASVSQIGDYVVIDKQGDIIPIAELEKAAGDFVLHSRAHGDMHQKMNTGSLIESMVFTPEKEKYGLVAKDENGKSIYGWWCGFEIDDPSVWSDYKAGKRPEFSIGGRSSYTET